MSQFSKCKMWTSTEPLKKLVYFTLPAEDNERLEASVQGRTIRAVNWTETCRKDFGNSNPYCSFPFKSHWWNKIQ